MCPLQIREALMYEIEECLKGVKLPHNLAKPCDKFSWLTVTVVAQTPHEF